jgi:pimeloyl-ACP methyl ester carboxylesterase
LVSSVIEGAAMNNLCFNTGCWVWHLDSPVRRSADPVKAIRRPPNIRTTWTSWSSAPHPAVLGKLLASDPNPQAQTRRPTCRRGRDPAFPLENLDGLLQYVPQLTIKRIPEGSPWVIREKPAEVNGYIRAFIG